MNDTIIILIHWGLRWVTTILEIQVGKHFTTDWYQEYLFMNEICLLETYLWHMLSRCSHIYGLMQERCTVYPKKYAHGFCFAVLCCGYTLTDFPISIRLTSLALWQSNDCPIASKATLMNMDKYFMWIHFERLHNHNKAKHNKTVCIFLGIYCNSPANALGLRLLYTNWLTHETKPRHG